MSTRAGNPFARGAIAEDWVAGVVSGLLAGVLAGVLLSTAGGGILREAIPASYGLATPAPLAGWVLHLIHTALLGLGYAWVVRRAPIDAVHRLRVGAAVGAGYGVVLWVAVGLVFMPTAMARIGVAAAPATAHLGALLGYAGFGIALGTAYAAVLMRPEL